MQKRTLPMYLFLNCITLGIYGFVVARQMNKEIDALCKGDGQGDGWSYVGATLMNLLPFIGPMYHSYWWYNQANRLKVNAGRYGLNVKESGTDIYVMRTVLEVTPMGLITLLEIGLAWIIPGLLVWLFSLMHIAIGLVFAIIFGIVYYVFRAELTFGANIANYYMMKNLNRFADVYRNGAAPFDPTGYEYYPDIANKYPNMLNGVAVAPAPVVDETEVAPAEAPTGLLQDKVGSLVGIKGSCAGYNFELASGEEIIIGKDAKVSMVVIDPAYKEISRKHVGVCFDVIRDQYRVIDYSSNGTWANGSKLVPGQEFYLPHGTELKLANDKNIFRLG